jgi:tripeptide aminopeptidase
MAIVSCLQQAQNQVWAKKKMPKLDSDKIVDSFVEAATIWAPSGFEKPMADKMMADFRSMQFSGAVCKTDEAGPQAGSEVGNVIVDIPASPDAPPGSKAIVLSCHLDRVPVRAPGVPDSEPVVIEETPDGKLQSKGKRTNIAADDRAGYTAIKEAIRAIDLAKIPHGHIKVIGFVREEPGLFGARALDPKHLQGMDYGFEVDGGKVGNVIRSSAGIQRFKVTIVGESAAAIHASQGKSALMAALDAGTKIANFQLSRGQTLNVSNISSGNIGQDGAPITNQVPDTAFIAGEFRAQEGADEKLMRRHVEDVLDSVKAQHGVQIQSSFDTIAGFNLCDTEPVVRLAEIATQSAGMKPKVMGMMGGTNANCLNDKGLPSVVLGSGAFLQHTEQEYTTRNDLVRATQVLMSVIAAAASPAVTAALIASSMPANCAQNGA